MRSSAILVKLRFPCFSVGAGMVSVMRSSAILVKLSGVNLTRADLSFQL